MLMGAGALCYQISLCGDQPTVSEVRWHAGTGHTAAALLYSPLCTHQHHATFHWNTAANSTRKCFKSKMFAEYLWECPTAAIIGESIKVYMLHQAINCIISLLYICSWIMTLIVIPGCMLLICQVGYIVTLL